MMKKVENSEAVWVDPDDAPPWTDDVWARAEIRHGDRVIRAATGTLTRPRGRPPIAAPKEKLTMRLDADIVRHFRDSGPGWQSRINDALKEIVFKR